jgi:c(7)-type cytochrome triheme protein
MHNVLGSALGEEGMSGVNRLIKILALLVIFIFAAGIALAVPPGRTLQFERAEMGPVVFDGGHHAEHGKFCSLCHPDVFRQKRGSARITKSDHSAGKMYCFACHTGTIAFVPHDNCSRRHEK